jgi:hypothetical protein
MSYFRVEDNDFTLNLICIYKWLSYHGFTYNELIKYLIYLLFLHIKIILSHSYFINSHTDKGKQCKQTE